METTVGVWQLATSALGAGVVAACVNHGLVWCKEKLALRSTCQHIALSAAVALERYAAECAYAINHTKQGVAEASMYDQRSPTNGAIMPDLALPDHTGWKCLDAGLAAQVLALPLQIRYSQQYIARTWELDDPFAAASELVREAARRGNDAWSIAAKLRHRYDLPEAALGLDEHQWDFRITLREEAHRKRIVASPFVPAPPIVPQQPNGTESRA